MTCNKIDCGQTHAHASEPKLIQMGKKYKTRDGRDVRILCVDGEMKSHPVVGLIDGQSYQWPADGKASLAGCHLVEVKEKVRIPVLCWYNRHVPTTLHGACGSFRPGATPSQGWDQYLKDKMIENPDRHYWLGWIEKEVE